MVGGGLGLLVAAWLTLTPSAGEGPWDVLPVGGGNAMTLPAQRHLVRLEPDGGRPAAWLLAVQQDGAQGHTLALLRSDDEARSFRYLFSLQNAGAQRDTTDLVPVGRDVALVTSYEGPSLKGSTAHDVYFRWLRYRAETDSFEATPAVRIFDSKSDSQAFSRAELARDSKGRLWVQAFRLEADGSSTAVLAVSTDGGASFQVQPTLDTVPGRGGGRLLALGSQLLFVYGLHDGFIPTRMRLRNDDAPLGSWGPVQQAFADGIYHGAALSAVADGKGGMHLVYKDEAEQLYYRHFSQGAFGQRVLLEGQPSWAMQSATTRVGDVLYVFYNRMLGPSHYELLGRALEDGRFSEPVTLDASPSFKGYPTAAEVLPAVPSGGVPCFYGNTPDANSPGQLRRVALVGKPSSPPPEPETPDAGTPDAGTPDAGTPPAGEQGLPFTDSFTRADGYGLGEAWAEGAGGWRLHHNRAVSDRDGENRVHVAAAQCADCRVSAAITSFEVEAGLFVRASDDGRTHYEAVLSGSAVILRRVRAGVRTELGRGPSGMPDAWTPVVLALEATGGAPVTLTVRTNGQERIRVTDGSASRITSEGRAGLVTPFAGVWFDDFALSSLAGTGGSGGTGTPDAGTPDAGTPDAGTPDAGTPDAGTPDAGTPDAGTPDAGTPDAGTPDAGTPTSQLVFQDGFNHPDAWNLGSSWELVQGLWRLYRNKAHSDLDGEDLALASTPTLQDARVQVDLTTYGVQQAGLVVRAEGSQRRYEALLFNDGTLRVYKVSAGSRTQLGRASSGATEQWSPQRLEVTVRGTSPVQLEARVNGTLRLSVTDSSPGSLAQPGRAGLWTTAAGVPFEDFVLWQLDGGGEKGDTPDAGTPETDPGQGALDVDVVLTDTAHHVLAVDPAGIVYAVPVEGTSQLVASTDAARTFAPRGRHPAGASFWMMTALSDGTLLADVIHSGGHHVARSTDGGRTWADVLSLGAYRTLTPRSWAEAEGTVFLLEYQSFTGAAAPLRLWASEDGGATWSQRATFSTHRHGHGLVWDAQRGALWAFFGDTEAQSALKRSTDLGRTWTTVVAGYPSNGIVGSVLADGTLLYGQDCLWQPESAHVVTASLDGVFTRVADLPGPSYSLLALAEGGYVLGMSRESGGDTWAPGEESAHLFVSDDGVHWRDVMKFPRASLEETARADVYWRLPGGELLLQLEYVQGLVSNKGFQVLRPVWR